MHMQQQCRHPTHTHIQVEMETKRKTKKKQIINEMRKLQMKHVF